MPQPDLLPGLRAALKIARDQYNHHRRQAAAEDNPDRYEDACAATAAARIVDKLEDAIAAEKTRGERNTKADRQLDAVMQQPVVIRGRAAVAKALDCCERCGGAVPCTCAAEVAS